LKKFKISFFEKFSTRGILKNTLKTVIGTDDKSIFVQNVYKVQILKYLILTYKKPPSQP
jgi:hypothetical protein